LGLSAALSACGSSRRHFVYAVGSNAETIFGFEEQSSGGLTNISGSPFSTGSVPSAIAVTPARNFAYVLSSGGNGILAYTFDKSKGGLVAAAGAVATGTTPVAIAIDPSSQHVYALNQGSSNISAYSIDQTTGALTPISGSPFSTVSSPVSMAMSGKGDALYVVSPTQGVASLSIKSDGTLAAGQAPIAVGASLSFVTVDPANHFVYVADKSANAVFGFTVSGTSLTAISGSFPTGTTPVSLAVRGDSKFLFVANQGSNNVSAFAIGSGGTLTAVSGSPFGAGTAPTFVTVNHNGNHVYAADRDSNDITDFAISGNGSLTAAPGSPHTIGTNPIWIAVTD
jgi:6-phosphogluconolactonase (cycloisomerase 2 family)